MGGECGGRDRAGLFGASRVRRVGAQIAQHMHAPFGDDFFGDFVDGREHAPDPARRGLVGHRAIGNGEMRLFDEAMPVYFEGNVLHPGRRAAREGRVDQRLEDVPDLRPAFADRLAHRLGMLNA